MSEHEPEGPSSVLGKLTIPTRLSPDSEAPEQREAKRQEAEQKKLDQLQRDRDNIWGKLLRDIGQRYAGVRLASFQAETDAQKRALAQLNAFCDSLDERTETGQGLVLTGPKGTGKDHLAISCLRAAVLHSGIEAAWVDGQTLYQEFRDGIDSETRERDAIRRYTAPKILLISDPVPPSESLTSFQQSVLWRIVDRRYRDLRPTWVTMNVSSGEEAEKRVGAQIVDRLRDGALSIVCNWPSHRKSAAIASPQTRTDAPRQ